MDQSLPVVTVVMVGIHRTRTWLAWLKSCAVDIHVPA